MIQQSRENLNAVQYTIRLNKRRSSWVTWR